MKAQELREKFIKFFEKRGHKKIPSASLIPENDATTLFINSGMHPLVPYLLGEPHPEGKRLCSIQKCLRTDDIEDVGDTFHHTFFEMLGNWSLGDYFKEEAIRLAWEFVVKELKIPSERLSVSCFKGDEDAPRDEEAAKIWQLQGIPKERIYFFGKKENWWAVGETGPCGPDTEIFYDTGKKACSPKCQPGCPCGKYFEIWNLVFMIYNRQQDGSLKKLEQKNVDTGMGLERTVAVLQGKEDDYQTELFSPIIEKIEELSLKKYEGENKKPMRIIADHLRAAVFLVADGVEPSNKDRGYILRRLIRRADDYIANIAGHYSPQSGTTTVTSSQKQKIIEGIIPEIFTIYTRDSNYEYLEEKESYIIKIIMDELSFYTQSTTTTTTTLPPEKYISGEEAFKLHSTHGFSPEQLRLRGYGFNQKDYDREFKKHQELSRKATKGKFVGGLQDNSPEVIKLHTATHLLHSALRKVLGEHVQQVGSNITRERLRFDFAHPKELTKKEIEKVEQIVNGQIKKNLKVESQTMDLKEAQKTGALAFFGQRYPEKVKVYSIGPSPNSGQAFSKEVCAGPHTDFTGELGKFIIKKEESSGAGKRRIYAVLGN